jgi:hypothetical protein
MLRPVLRRALFLIPILALVNFAAFAYAHGAAYVQQASNPYGTTAMPPDVPALYAAYLQQALADPLESR